MALGEVETMKETRRIWGGLKRLNRVLRININIIDVFGLLNCKRPLGGRQRSGAAGTNGFSSLRMDLIVEYLTGWHSVNDTALRLVVAVALRDGCRGCCTEYSAGTLYIKGAGEHASQWGWLREIIYNETKPPDQTFTRSSI